MDHTNPAFRLLSIIEEGKKLDSAQPCMNMWARLLKLDVNSPEFLSRLGKVMELPSLIVQTLKVVYPDDPNTWEHWSAQIKNAFIEQRLNSHWGTFIDKIDSHTLNYLRIHAKLLQVQSKTNPLENEILNKTRSDLNDCLVELMNSEIDHNVKIYLARNIRKLIQAIDEYHLTGTTGVFDSIEIVMGHQVFDPKYKEYLRETDIGQRISTIVGTVADAMSIVMGLPQIGASLNKLIGK